MPPLTCAPRTSPLFSMHHPIFGVRVVYEAEMQFFMHINLCSWTELNQSVGETTQKWAKPEPRSRVGWNRMCRPRVRRTTSRREHTSNGAGDCPWNIHSLALLTFTGGSVATYHLRAPPSSRAPTYLTLHGCCRHPVDSAGLSPWLGLPPIPSSSPQPHLPPLWVPDLPKGRCGSWVHLAGLYFKYWPQSSQKFILKGELLIILSPVFFAQSRVLDDILAGWGVGQATSELIWFH